MIIVRVTRTSQITDTNFTSMVEEDMHSRVVHCCRFVVFYVLFRLISIVLV